MLKHSSAPKYRAAWVQTISGKTHVKKSSLAQTLILLGIHFHQIQFLSNVILIPFCIQCTPSEPLFRDSVGISWSNILFPPDFRWNLFTLWISLVTDLQGGSWPISAARVLKAKPLSLDPASGAHGICNQLRKTNLYVSPRMQFSLVSVRTHGAGPIGLSQARPPWLQICGWSGKGSNLLSQELSCALIILPKLCWDLRTDILT